MDQARAATLQLRRDALVSLGKLYLDAAKSANGGVSVDACVKHAKALAYIEHLEAKDSFATNNHELFKELKVGFEEALGPHPTIPNGQWIRRINELRGERDLLKEQMRHITQNARPG